jgi:hypothetical protein
VWAHAPLPGWGRVEARGPGFRWHEVPGEVPDAGDMA